MDLDCKMRQRAEARQLAPVIIRPARFACADGHTRSEVAWSEPPKVEVGECVTLPLNRLPKVIRHAPVRVHVEQDRAGVADKPSAQLAITKAPTIPASGSIQSHPNARARIRPMMTSTDTAASAMT